MKNENRKKTLLASLGLTLLLSWPLAGQETGTSQEDERIQKLEQAVRQLQEQNQELMKQIQSIRAVDSQGDSATPPVEAASKAAPTPNVADNDIRVFWKNGINFETQDGKLFTGKLGGRVQVDTAAGTEDAGVEAAVGEMPFAVEFRRARIALEGEIGLPTPTSYKLETDFGGGEVSLKDAYVGLGGLPYIHEVQVGHFKEPFSLEELTSSKYLTFMERATPIDAFSPARNTGFKIGGAEFEEQMTWALGAFTSVGDFGEGRIDSNYRITGRLTTAPWYEDKGRKLLHLGASGSFLEPEGETLRFDARPEVHLAPRYADTGRIAADRAQFAVAEAALVHGPLSVQGEYFQTWVDGPGNPTFDGFYLFGSWFLTGEHRPYKRSSGTFDRLKPQENFSLEGGGIGAWEVGLRYSHLDLNDAGVSGGRLDDITAALNWYLNPNARVMFNYVLANLNRGAADDDQAHLFQTRFQVDF